MATKKKMLQAAAGQATGGGGLDITDVFSTYLYTGNGSTQTITNGIDLAGEGGLVWAKIRDTASTNHMLVDTERGTGSVLRTNFSSAEQTGTFLNSFNSDGFTLANNFDMNGSGYDIASWTFRKAPKFFDVVTWDGDGVAGRAIPHNLGSVPGMIIVKCTSSAADWTVYHRGTAADPETDALFLNTTSAANDHPSYWNDTAPTDTVFSVGNGGEVNGNFSTYVAYLFAHNDGDGEFGPDADQDIIKCGSYTGSSGNTEIDLGFEPQWIMIKRTDTAEDWLILDVMRGWVNSGDDVPSSGQKDLFANTSSAEATPSYAGVTPQPNGFKVRSGLDGLYSSNGGTYIYMAIRRGPLAQPESGTEVFAIDTGTGASDLPKYISNFPVDMAIITSIDAVEDRYNSSRLTGARYLQTNTTAAESGTNANFSLDYNDGWFEAGGTNRVSWMWKRAPGFCDVVAYTGNQTAGLQINHNLGVVPEMMWVKNRGSAEPWAVYHKDIGNTKSLRLNDINAVATENFWNGTTPTETVFTLGANSEVNFPSGRNYIAYLFATLPGVSKVGSFTGNGSTQNIDCGFTSGARFVLIKRTDANGDWWVLDTERGIVAGNDALIALNTTSAEVTSVDVIDPNSSGFTVDTTNGDFNASGGSYIFYAIA